MSVWPIFVRDMFDCFMTIVFICILYNYVCVHGILFTSWLYIYNILYYSLLLELCTTFSVYTTLFCCNTDKITALKIFIHIYSISAMPPLHWQYIIYWGVVTDMSWGDSMSSVVWDSEWLNDSWLRSFLHFPIEVLPSLVVGLLLGWQHWEYVPVLCLVYPVQWTVMESDKDG